MPFTHLHLHTEYSLLDGANRIAQLPARIKELGMDACAITDHGVMYGVVDFYTACREAAVKPIIGCEVYVASGSRLDKNGALDKRNSHLILLAENNLGLQNLQRLVSQAFMDGFYYRPRIDLELLRAHHEGLIALSSCLSGAINQQLMINNRQAALENALLYQEIMGTGNYYLEVQANGMLEQRKANAALRELSQETGIPLVATNDCHYMRYGEARAHEILLCIQTGKRLSDPEHMRMGSDQYYIKSPEEMARDLPDFADALANTELIARRCHVELDTKTIHLPVFAAPDGQDSPDYLRDLSREGLEQHLQSMGKVSPSLRREYEARLDYELSVITKMGYTDYYLIVWDFIDFARRREIMVGPGRGSGAGSLVAFALKITNIDPIQYKLIFERFLNPERVSMPDFDTDFCYERRGEVIDYVTQKYGQERVAQVITFGTLAAKACVRDVARVLDLPYDQADRLAKLIPFELKMTIQKALDQQADLKKAYMEEPQTREILDTAMLLEGMPRHASTHAAGVVISSLPLTDLVPLSRNEDAVVIQYAKSNIEKLGLLKFDFLGLRTLTVLRDTRDMVKKNYGRELDLDHLPMDDPKVFEMIASGDTAGVFQLESSGMTSFMKELKPESMEDIIAGVALYRPGPMNEIPRYVAARHDKSKIRYDHRLLEPILHVTYGVIVYQEQVMQIVQELAGFSLGQADNIRKAISSKNVAMLETYHKLFVHGGLSALGQEVDGAVKRGVTLPIADKLFKDVLSFAGYAFNKSHAAAYAVVAYQTAWLKYYYPTEFMAALLNSFLGSLGQARSYAQAAREMGIRILPPDVNHSEVKFTTEGDKSIRFALGAVKNAGKAVLEALVKERREGGVFLSFGDFLRRMNQIHMNKKVVESLIKSSALDSFQVPRNQLLAVYESFLNQISSSKQQVMEGQMSLFDLGAPEMKAAEPDYPTLPDLAKMDLLSMEEEMLGLYVTGHPLDEYRGFLETLSLFPSLNLAQADEGDAAVEEEALRERLAMHGKQVFMAGLVLQRSNKTTRRQEPMAILLLEDLSSRYEAFCFSGCLKDYGDLIVPGRVLLFQGSLSMREDEDGKLMVRAVAACDKAGLGDLRQKNSFSAPKRFGNGPGSLPGEAAPAEQRARGFALEINYPGSVGDAGYKILTATLAFFHGPTPVKLKLADRPEACFLPQICWVDACNEVLNILAERYGDEALRFVRN